MSGKSTQLTRQMFLASAFVLCVACANQNSIFRVADTSPSKTETILIDAKQRPIMVNTVSDPMHPKVCLSRSADALSQAAISGNLKIDQTSGAGGELGLAEAEQVTSIAFRTQVTEAQQEYLYYLCQLNSNNSLDSQEVSDNLRHFQNTMLAMVAVDDLAGAGKAAAAAPPPTDNKNDSGTTTPPTSPTAPDAKIGAMTDASASVTNAKNAEKTSSAKVSPAVKAVAAATTTKDGVTKSKALTANLKDVTAKEKLYATKIAALRAAVKAAASKDFTEPTEVTQASSAVDDAAKAAKTALDEVNTANAAVVAAPDTATLKSTQATLTSKAGDYQTADTTYVSALDTLATAANASGTTVTKAAKAAADKPPAKSGDSVAANTAAVANSVATIVQTVVWQSFITEKCLKQLFNPAAGSAPSAEATRFCIWHLYMADQFRFEQLRTNAANNPQNPQDPLGIRVALPAPQVSGAPLFGQGPAADFAQPPKH